MAQLLRHFQSKAGLARQISSEFRILFPGCHSHTCTIGFATRSSPFEDKERGEENIRFRKEDERLLRQLLNKVKKQADAVDVHEAASSQSVELVALKEILGKYNVSDEDLQKVLEWKHT